MKILVIGSGGREHALVWKIAQSPIVKKIYCSPGNGGISRICKCVDIEVTDLKGLADFASKKQIDLTIVGPEKPLAFGIVDFFQKQGLPIFGPSKMAAEIESSKIFSKYIMKKYKIPTAGYSDYSDYNQALKAINAKNPPFVIKADGLAAGKGVILCSSRSEAFDGLDMIMKAKKFGNAGNRVIIEDYLEGEEVSILAVTDGDDFVLLPHSQDHKPIFEGDTGPNTGGMGAYSPAPLLSDRIINIVNKKILSPVIKGMKNEGRPYKGVLYAGLMITSRGPKVLEFNCRFGDPETQAILPLLDSDIVSLMMASINREISQYKIKIFNKTAVCVIMASGGYPGEYEKGTIIKGLDSLDNLTDVIVFHAGTKIKGRDIVTSGGRVLGITAVGDTIKSSVEKAYNSIGKITFDGAYYRKDIAYRALK